MYVVIGHQINAKDLLPFSFRGRNEQDRTEKVCLDRQWEG